MVPRLPKKKKIVDRNLIKLGDKFQYHPFEWNLQQDKKCSSSAQFSDYKGGHRKWMMENTTKKLTKRLYCGYNALVNEKKWYVHFLQFQIKASLTKLMFAFH